MTKQVEIPSYGICPNCWNENFCIETRSCPECWYDLEHNFPSPYERLIDTIEETQLTIIKNIVKRPKIEFWNYKTYEIIINPSTNKIIQVKYYYKNKKYLVSIDNYEIIEKHYNEIEFSEPETSPDHIQHHDIAKITNLKIKWIWPKVKNWYGERIFIEKHNFDNLKSFISYVILHIEKI